MKEEDAEAQHTVHDGEGAVQSHILNTPKVKYTKIPTEALQSVIVLQVSEDSV